MLPAIEIFTVYLFKFYLSKIVQDAS